VIATVLQRLMLGVCCFENYFCLQISERSYENTQNKGFVSQGVVQGGLLCVILIAVSCLQSRIGPEFR
jgi:hypothetical protein